MLPPHAPKDSAVSGTYDITSDCTYVALPEDVQVRPSRSHDIKKTILTKPLLDVIDDLCSGASTNCDRKKLNQELETNLCED